jgi:hypothetical protein
MNTPGRGQVPTGAQLAMRLAALKGRVPDATQYAVYHAGVNGVGPGAYLVPGEAQLLDAAAFEATLAAQGLVGTDRLAVAVLVVRACLDPTGDIENCTLEYRRGAVDGPYHGNPAVITFTGPVQTVRFHQAMADGQLREIAPAPGMLEQPETAAQGRPAGSAAAVPLALQACFGGPVRVTGTRNPTVIEAMAGFARVLHVAVPGRGETGGRETGGRETGCGILWHGPIAVALPAAFPRFDLAPRPPPRQLAALVAALAAEGLVACAARRDAEGVAVLARHPGGADPFLARFDDGRPRITPHLPARPAGLADAQAQWLDYIETYERLRVLDIAHEAASDTLIAVTLGPDDRVWRHSVDEDGVEIWRTAAWEDAGLPAPEALAGTHAETGPLKAARETADAGSDTTAEKAPFGPVVDARFPSAAYDIDEAVQCLDVGRSTGAVFHALRVIEHGIRGYAAWRGAPDPLTAPSVPRWRVLLRWVRNDPDSDDLYASLDAVRAAWRDGELQVGSKYTEAEAARIVAVVEHFMCRVAALCDEKGVPAGELDDEA